MVEKAVGYLEYIFAGFTAIAIMIVALWKFAGLSKRQDNSVIEIKTHKDEIKKYKDGIDKDMLSLNKKVDKAEIRINDVEKSVPVAVSKLERFAIREFTRVSEMREKFAELSKDNQEIKDILTEMRTKKIETQSNKIETQGQRIEDQTNKINELLSQLRKFKDK